MVLVPREGKGGGGLPRRQQFFRVLWVFFLGFSLTPCSPQNHFFRLSPKISPPLFHISLVFIGEVWLGHNLVPKHFLFFSFFSFFFFLNFDFFIFENEQYQRRLNKKNQ
jgi:hypothetical protein